jgi:hypothetical protein
MPRALGRVALIAGLCALLLWARDTPHGARLLGFWLDGLGALQGEQATPALPAETAAQVTAEAKNALRVLFVGNSHTYYNAMPRTIAGLAQAAGEERPLHAQLVVQNGARLPSTRQVVA